ncbi:MAG: TolC family protein [Candidatus Acidiferrales bacterium]
MIRGSFLTAGLILASVAATPCRAQAPQKLTLADAEALAMKNHPSVQSAQLRAEAAKQLVTEARSAYFPFASANLTGVESSANSRIAAGALNNPLIFTRYSNGLTVNQLVTDFGRTHELSEAARSGAESRSQSAVATRADILLQVDRAYYRAQQAQTVLRVAQETVKSRQLVSEQATALEKNKLKSSLDVSFANVNLEEAKLLLVQAQNQMDAAFADLSTALGYPRQHTFELEEQPLPGPPTPDPAPLIDEALRQRPELLEQRYSRDSARYFAKAERDLWLPTISAAGSAGLTPVFQDNQLKDHYAAAGFNVNIPIFNGRLFNARKAEADLQAQAADQDVRALEDQISHDVRTAWLNANTAYQRLDLTDQLFREASMALNLAQARYKLGLSSIVELSQAQLSQTEAEIQQASAKYDYQIQNAMLNYEIGRRR